MSTQFKRQIENFTCLRCGARVRGNGYTNHCPRCLWSRHVDEFPGDRAAQCGGPMAPVAVEPTTGRRGAYRVTHRCERCGLERRVRLVAGDDPLALLSGGGTC